MVERRIISSDNHVIEPVDLWTSRVEPKYAWRAPHVEDLGEQGDFWVCDGRKIIGVTGGSDKVGVRFDDPDAMHTVSKTENVRPGGYDPDEHVKDLDIDGMDISILYPTVGFMLYGLPDGELLDSLCRSYNDWVGEFCSAHPKRLKGIAMFNVDDVGIGIKELERAHKMGFIGAMLAVYPREGHFYNQPKYDDLWAASVDMGMPLSLHIGGNRYSPVQELADPDIERPAFICNADYWPRMSICDMIFAGVFERFPKLQVGSVEHELGWVPFFLDRMDYTYSQRGNMVGKGNFKDGVLPSDFFRSNCFLGFQEDGEGVRQRHVIGVDTLQWGADYPHSEGTFPRSREIVEGILAECTEDEKDKIVGGNAARIYNL